MAVYKLREYNRDLPHTNFYYSLLRLWWIGNDGKTSISSLKWHGCGLNLLFFVGTFWGAFALFKRLFGGENKGVICAGLVAATLNTGAISNTILIRPYALQEMFLVLFTLWAVTLLSKMRNDEKIVSPLNRWLYGLLTALTLLAAYFSVVYVVLLFALLLFFAFRGSEKGTVPFLCETFVVGVVLATVIYPNYPLGFFIGRAGDVASNFALTNFVKNIVGSVYGLSGVLNYWLYYTPVLILLIAFGIWRYVSFKKASSATEGFSLKGVEIALLNSRWLPLLLAGIALVWAGGVMFLAPAESKTLRYVVAIFPILSLAIPWLAYSYNGCLRKVYIFLSIAVFLVASVAAEKSGQTFFKISPYRIVSTDAAEESVQRLSCWKLFRDPICAMAFVFPNEKEAYEQIIPPSSSPVVIAAKRRASNVRLVSPYFRNSQLFKCIDEVDDLGVLSEIVRREKTKVIIANSREGELPEGILYSAKKNLAYDFAAYTIDHEAVADGEK